MKYLKYFEKKKRKEYKGFRQKQADAFSRSEKFGKFVSGQYIIFSYASDRQNDIEDGPLIFGKILKVEEVDVQLNFDKYSRESYLELHVIDYVDTRPGISFEWIGKNLDKTFNLHLVQTLYTSISLKDAQERYDKLSDEWVTRMAAKSYNL